MKVGRTKTSPEDHVDTWAADDLARLRSGELDADETGYQGAISRLTTLAILDLRGRWDRNVDAVGDDVFINPARHPNDVSIWDAEMMDLINHVVCEMYEALGKPWSEDFESLSAGFAARLIRFGKNYIKKGKEHRRGRTSLLVDGVDGPTKARRYVDRFVADEARELDRRACSDHVAASNDEDFEEWCEWVVGEALRIASPADRRTLEQRSQEKSAEQAAEAEKRDSGIATTGQTVRNRHRRLMSQADPSAGERWAEHCRGRRGRVRAAEGRAGPTGRVRGNAGSPPKQEPGE